MSADNWSECPICKNKKKKDVEKLQKAYGNISMEKFQEMVEELDNQEADEYDGTPLREDYEVGVSDDGLAYIIYSGICQNCGASWQFDKRGIKNKEEMKNANETKSN